jgi:cell division protein FtsW
MANSLGTLIKRWTSSIDVMSFSAIVVLIAIGIWISIASTPAVASRLGVSQFYFVKQHLLVVPIGAFLIIIASFLRINHICKLSVFTYIICLLALVSVLLFGNEIKGAKRWLSIFGYSIQPSEFLKPTIIVISAWLISEQYRERSFPGIWLAILAVTIVIPLLLLQPDVGMTLVIVLTLVGQLFVSGISIFSIFFFMICCGGAAVGLYCFLPHFHDRVSKFLDQKMGVDADFYQVQKSIEALKNGKFLGKGPGEGVVKTLVPDAHSDFVFSVIGEEFGFILCTIIVLLFVIVIIRSMIKAIESSSIFSFATIFGIVIQISLQVLINISTALNLIPTKGMTLPFISYGGSSFLASSITIGILLAVTKRSSIQANRY